MAPLKKVYSAVSEFVLYQENKPGKFLRNYSVYPYANHIFDYGGDVIYNGYAVAANGRRPAGVPAVVIDAGSAVTVDWIDATGAFVGGAINRASA